MLVKPETVLPVAGHRAKRVSLLGEFPRTGTQTVSYEPTILEFALTLQTSEGSVKHQVKAVLAVTLSSRLPMLVMVTADIKAKLPVATVNQHTVLLRVVLTPTLRKLTDQSPLDSTDGSSYYASMGQAGQTA